MEASEPQFARPHAASFRDPGSRVYQRNGRIIRALSPAAAEEFRFLRDSGLVEKLTGQGRLIESIELDPKEFSFASRPEAPAIVLEHPRIPFVSYPYEWSFLALQSAALFHLDLQVDILEAGATLSDASAYNIQFQGARPIFIDVPSLRRYREGELWLAHRQFCEQFLNPLLLQAVTGVPYHAWYRGSLEGIPTGQLRRFLPWKSKLHWLVLAHVVLQDRLQQSACRIETAELRAAADHKLSRKAFAAILSQLRRWIERLRPVGAGTSKWSRYEFTRSYDDEAKSQKSACVAEFVQAVRPGMLWDLGCNAGEYSLLAARSGAGYVVGFDYDIGALDEAFRRSEHESAPFLPLFFDAANPSPSQGWRQREREGFHDRGSCDAVLALAFEHHLTIGRNIPIPEFLDWLLGLAPRGVVEFVDKADMTIQKMLAMRADIFEDYSLQNFEHALASRSRIVKKTSLRDSSRILYCYERQT